VLPGVNNDNPINDAYMFDLNWDKFFNELLPGVINKGGIINKNFRNGKYTYFTNDSYYLIPEIAVTEGANFLGVHSYTRKGHLDFNNEGMKDVTKRLNTLYLQGYYDDILTAGTYQNSLLTERETLFCVASSASYQYIRSDNDKIRALPLSLFGESYMQGFHAALLSHNNPQKALASWLFLKHITSEEVLIEFVKTSPYLATRYSVLAEYINNSYFNNMLEADIKINIPYSDLSFLPSFKGFNQVNQTLQKLYFECLTDTDLIHNIDNHFNKAYKECEKYI
jgi:ABC-type glycerol-3-phosphate transport system substrate-binding protein